MNLNLAHLNTVLSLACRHGRIGSYWETLSRTLFNCNWHILILSYLLPVDMLEQVDMGTIVNRPWHISMLSYP